MANVEDVRKAGRQFRAERDWERFQDPKSVLLALVGEVGEVAELLQWLPADRARELVRAEPLHATIADELADVFIYLVDLAEQCDVDLVPAALSKIERTAARYPVQDVHGVAPDRTKRR